jgi:phosphatidylethanolamine/phosphatidyl-N-methylethanolamine N-methyltransferase
MPAAARARPRASLAWETEAARRRYDRGAATYDLREGLMELVVRRWRRALWALVPPGRILEVGVGTGKNIPYYPNGAEVTAVDFSPKMLERAKRRAQRAGNRAGLQLMDAQALAFSDGSFDSAVATFVFCSVPDPVLGLSEVRRVLKPGGRLYLLEHVRSDWPVLGRLMDFVNPLFLRMTGANLNRRTVENVRRAGFSILEVRGLSFGPGRSVFKRIVAARD